MGLRAARLRRRLTQTELAKRAHVGQTTLAMLELMARPNPRWFTAARLCQALRMSPWTVFGRPRTPRARTAA